MVGEQLSVIKVRNVLIVTVPGDPDDDTISQLQQKILQAMEYYEPKGVILDISTVQIIDSYFARTIVETAQMVRLMGGVTVIAGMQGSVAITATQLGLTLGNLNTALDVDRALDMMEDTNE